MTLNDTPLSLESRVRRMHRELSEAERKLADVVLARQHELLGYTATELASLAGTSKSTAARFFRRVGFADFEDFRQQLRQAQAQQSPLARMGQARRGDGLAQRFQTHLQNDAQRLQALAQAVSEDQLEAALQLLARARRVWVVGYRHSRVTAFYAQTLLAQVRGDVQDLNDAAGREADLLAGAGDKDLVLAVDFRRRSANLPRMLAAVRATGAQVLLLTDAPGSALALQSQLVLRCSASAPDGVFDSYVCAISLVNFLASALAARSRTSARARLESIERLHLALGDLEPQI